MWVFMEERPNQRAWFPVICSQVSTEGAERTGCGRLLHRARKQGQNALASVLVLTLGTNRMIPLYDLNAQDGSGLASMD